MDNIRLQKLKSALKIQKQKLEEYLLVVGLEKKALLDDKIMKASEYLHHERELISSVKAQQKVIPPLEAEIGEVVLYGSREIRSLKNSLESLRKEVRAGIKVNHSILARKKAVIEAEIRDIRKTTALRRRSGYSASPSMIDLKL